MLTLNSSQRSFKNILSKLPNWSFLFLFVTLAILSRLPYFNRWAVEWDESTFLLMGQDVLNGNLPYTNLWDLKPPLCFYLYSFILWIAGDSFITFRLIGSLYVGVSVWLIFLTVQRIEGRTLAIIAGLTLICLTCILTTHQAFLSEHLALLPIGMILLILSKENKNKFDHVLLGTAAAAACYIKLNLAFIAPALCLIALLPANKENIKSILINVVAISIGFWMAAFFIALPFILSGNFSLYLDTVYIAPMKYTEDASSFFRTAGAQVYLLLLQFTQLSSGFAALFYVAGTISSLIISYYLIKDKKQIHVFYLCNIIILIAVEFSLLKSGKMNLHYIIQLTPMLAVCISWTIKKVCSRIIYSPKTKNILLSFGVLLLIAGVSWNYPLYPHNQKSHQDIREACAVNYLKSVLVPNDSIYVLEGHVIYWLVGKTPLRPSITHPSNFTKEYLLDYIPGAETTSSDELNAILKADPTYVVTPKMVWYFRNNNFGNQLKNELNERYDMKKLCDNFEIWRLKEPR